MEALLDFLAGAVTVAFLVSSAFFLRFWKKTSERLFLAFGVAFVFLALNQVAATYLEAGDERTIYAYALRVIAFTLIVLAIVDKNVSSGRR